MNDQEEASAPHEPPRENPIGDSIGTAAEELARLLATASTWLREHIATGEPSCQVCPLCQLISAVRASNPDAAEQVQQTGAAWMGKMRDFVASMAGTADQGGWAGASDGAGEPDSPDATQKQTRTEGRVRPIKVEGEESD